MSPWQEKENSLAIFAVLGALALFWATRFIRKAAM
jgi:hypothetical protein